MQTVYVIITPEQYRDNSIILDGAQYHHLAHVRRVRVGMPLRAALPDGGVLHAEISAITAESITACITGEERIPMPACRITLYQTVLKGEKMEMVVQKACELGATRLTPLLTARSVPRWTPEQARERATRWQRIADAAAEQCERAYPLQVDVPHPLPDVLATLPTLALLLHERHGEPLRQLADRTPTVPDLGLFLGPEGGWDNAETAALLAAGVHPINLGPRILRAETATIAALTLAQFLWGDL